MFGTSTCDKPYTDNLAYLLPPHTHLRLFCGPDGIRTHNNQNANLALYQLELPAHSYLIINAVSEGFEPPARL